MSHLIEQARALLPVLRAWPWLDTARTLLERFREDRLGLTASSLTFTTLISLVPLVTVGLAVFSAFPMFAGLEIALQKFFVQNLVPAGIAKPVLGALTTFASKARGMGTVGLALLVVSALALVMTIDRTLNAIWRVRRRRSLGRRVLVYWAALTLGPLVMGLSLSLTGWVLSMSGFAAGARPLAWLVNIVQFGLLALTAAGLYHYVPNTAVRWSHALAGGVFVAAGFEAAKRGLAWYLEAVPTFSAVYGAFASLPILMLWMYLVWLVVLLGAVMAAYAPSLQMRVSRRAVTPGWRFELALAVLKNLHAARQSAAHGVSLAGLSTQLRVDPLQLEQTLELLCSLDWVQRLAESQPAAEDDPRFVLLCDPAATSTQALVRLTLIDPGPASQAFVSAGGVQAVTLLNALSR